MPVVFAPAEPLAPSVSQGYGAAAAWQHDFPTLQRQQQGVAEAYLQSAALQQRAQQANLELQQRASQGAATLDLQQQHQQQQVGLAREQMSHQSDMQQQHASLQDQLAANQLTRGEQMRLERLRNAVGDVMANPDLDETEKRAAVMQLRTGIDPLQRRQAAAQQQHAELSNQAMQRQIAQFDQLQREREAFQSKNLTERVSTFIDDYGERRSVVMGREGNVDWHATDLLFGHQAPQTEDNRARTGGTTRNASTGGTGGAAANFNMTPQQLETMRTRVRNRAVGTQANPGPRWADRENPALLDAWVASEVDREVEALRTQHAEHNAQPERPPDQRRQRFADSLRQVEGAFPNLPHHVHRQMASEHMRATATADDRLGPQTVAPSGQLVPHAPGGHAARISSQDEANLQNHATFAATLPAGDPRREELDGLMNRVRRLLAEPGVNGNPENLAPSTQEVYRSLWRRIIQVRNPPTPPPVPRQQPAPTNPTHNPSGRSRYENYAP